MKNILFPILIVYFLPYFSYSQPFTFKKLTSSPWIGAEKVCVLPASYIDHPFEALLKTADSANARPSLKYKISVVPVLNDSSRPAILIIKMPPSFFNIAKYNVWKIYPNGNPEQIWMYDKKYRLHTRVMDYYKDQKIKSWKQYNNGKPMKRWRYYDEKGCKVKVEVYRHGLLKRTRICKHPRRTWRRNMGLYPKKGINYKLE